MKNTIKYIICILLMINASACMEELDKISYVDPGLDEAPPVVKINNPMDGLTLQVKEDITSLNVEFEASDDIELGNITVKVDGKDAKSYTSSDYTDYRKFKTSFKSDGLANGMHSVEVTATDLAGKVTTVKSNFEKKEAYKAIYDNEIF